MFRINSTDHLPIIQPALTDEGNIWPLVVSEFEQQDFCLNEFGWVANDVSLLMKASTQQEYDLIAQRLQEIKKNNPDTSKMSDGDIIKSIWPRFYQSPSEISNFMDYYNSNNPVPQNVVESKSVENVESESSPNDIES